MPARFLSLVLLAACSTGLQDATFPTGSTTIVTTTRGAVVNVNEDEGTLSMFLPDQGLVSEIDVGSRPARVAKVGEQLWVTLRGERAVAIVEIDEQGAMSVARKIDAGIEPFGIVANEQGTRIYVAASRSGQVLELDASGAILRTFDVPNEPRWLALHPTGKALYVGSLFNGHFSHIDLGAGTVDRLALPQTFRFGSDGDIFLKTRLTGDPAINPTGTEMAIPVLMVDNDTPVTSGGEVDPTEKRPEGGEGYGSSTAGVSRLNPALVVFDLDSREGDVEGNPDALFLASSSFGMVFEREDPNGGFGLVRSYPTSVTITNDAYLVTAESSSSIYAVRRAPFLLDVDFGGSTDVDFGAPDGGPFFTPASQAGFEEWPVVPIATGPGPRGITMASANTAYVHTFLDRAVAAVDVLTVESNVRQLQTEFFFENPGNQVLSATQVAAQKLTAAEERGRTMFYSADDENMAGTGAGVSCSTCHFDSRNDGFTWDIDGMAFQTPSLAGPVSETAPVTWADNVASVADEAQLTTQLRMGGQGLSETAAAEIAAYVETTPYPQGKHDATDALVQEGNRVFIQAGCAECHSGEHYTDNDNHVIVNDLSAQTPTLRGVGASAPYMHDGRAPTLRAVVELARDGSMGDTSDLTDSQIDALVAFLESL